MTATTRSKAHSENGAAEDELPSGTRAGSKHKLAERNEPHDGGNATKKQKTLEDTINNGKDNKTKSGHSVKPREKGQDTKSKPSSKPTSKPKPEPQKKKQHDDSGAGPEPNKSKSEPSPKAKTKKEPQSTKEDGSPPKSSSSILEKGIIYFFLRGRVNTDTPSSVSEIARTFILLRPSSAASPSSKPTPLHGDRSRLLAVPKKTLPTSGRERWISFVEKTGVSFADLKTSFLPGNDHETKTRGTQHTPAATPVGEGVYAITTTSRESHLCYILTIPERPGEVQEKMGLRDKGSFVISTRNPEYRPPGNASLPEGPAFPEEIKREFNSRRWAPTNPKHLDVEGAQILLIGESSGISKATQPPKDREQGEEDPREELEDLAEEDEKRMEALGKDDSESIFADLHASAKDYPKVQTTF